MPEISFQEPVDLELAFEGELEEFPLPESPSRDEEQALLGLSQKPRSPLPTSPSPEKLLPSRTVLMKNEGGSKRKCTTSKKVSTRKTPSRGSAMLRGRTQVRALVGQPARPQSLVRIPVLSKGVLLRRSRSQSTTPPPIIEPPHVSSHLILDRDQAFVCRCSQVILEGPSPALKTYERKSSGSWPPLLFAMRTEVLVISDSVLRPLQGCPKGWEVHVYPGAHFYDIDKLLYSVQYQAVQHLKCIVIYAGVNHRSDTQLEALRSQVRNVLGHGLRLRVKIYFFLIAIPLSMDRGLQERLAEINDVIKHASDGYYCPALPPYLVRQKSRDQFGIHYDEATAQWIVRAMAVHLEDVAAIISGRAASCL